MAVVAPGQANQAFANVVKSLEQISKDQQGGKGDVGIGNLGGVDINARAKEYGIKRTAWIMSTTEWLITTPQRALVWYANPSEISWSMPQRSVHSKNLFGTVLHVWPDNFRNTFFDELKLTLSLQSGNIMPVFVKGSISSAFSSFNKAKDQGLGGQVKSFYQGLSGEFKAAGGLANFYDFMQLVDAPKLTKDGRSNLISIQYSSNLFPKLTLIGMFDPAGITFRDYSGDPNQVTGWSADFIVYDTVPRLTDNSGQQSNNILLANWLEYRIGKSSK